MIFDSLGMIIAAGGSGSRFSKTENKLLVDFRGKPVLIHALSTFLPVLKPGNMAIAAPANLLEEMKALVDSYLPGNMIKWTVGGATRLASVANAAGLLDRDLALVAIHDAARPQATVELLEELCKNAKIHGGAIPGIAPVDTVKAVDENGIITANLIRKNLALVATPQVFCFKDYLSALASLPEELLAGKVENAQLTDDAAVFMQAGFKVKVVFSQAQNTKITVKSDIDK